MNRAFFITLLIPSVCAGALLTPTSVELVTGSEFYPLVNVINGSGLSGIPTEENYAELTHSSATSSSAWTTNAPGGGSADYFKVAAAPVILLGFPEVRSFSDFIFWGYHFGNPNGNEARSFTLDFSSDGGVTFPESVSVSAPAITISSLATLSLGGDFFGDVVRVTMTDNWFDDYGGGDRVGVGEIRFLGEITVDPDPRIETGPLVDFGSHASNPGSVTQTLTITNVGGQDDLVITPSFPAGSPFSGSAAVMTIPASGSSDLVVNFSPVMDGCFSEVLVLATNDPARSVVNVALIGAVNCTFPEPEKPNFSREEGVFTGSFELTLVVENGETIIYTLDGSMPRPENGLVYEGPVTLAATTQVRAVSFFPGHSLEIRTRSYVRLAADVASYSSNLPIMVVENFGAGSIPNKGWSTNTPTGAGLQQRARQSAFLGVFESSTVGGQAFLNSTPAQTSRMGIRVRGAFSSTWTPKPYSVEMWKTDEDADRKIKILGMASEADWIFYYPHPSYDRSLLYDTFIWELSRQTGRWAPDFRFVDVFVNEDGGDLKMSDRQGVYVFLEKPERGSGRMDYDALSEDGVTGGWMTSVNRMDAIPVGGFPAENGATTPQFFHTAGPNRVQSTSPNSAGSGDDIPRQYNAFINFEDPNGYRISATQRGAIEGWFRDFEDVFYDDSIWRDPVNGYRQHLDTTDFIDYFQMLTLAKQGDGLLLSMFPWVSSGERKLRMGPMWDFNNGAYSGSTTGTLYFRPNRLWYGRLFDDPDFQREYEDRWFELRRGPLSNANMAAILDAQAGEITPALAGQQTGLTASSFTSRVNTMKSWLQSRADWIDSNFLSPPGYSAESGVVDLGFALILTNTTGQSGTIFYTYDGSDPMDSGIAYTGPITFAESAEVSARVQTSSGAWSAIRGETFVVGIPASAANLIVSELMYHPSDGQPGTEFVELLNTSTTETIDLTNVVFTDGITFEFPVNTRLLPGERILVIEDRAAFESAHGMGFNIAGEFSNATRLANSGEQIVLTSASGAVIVDFTFDDTDPWPEFADGQGCSLTLIGPESHPDLNVAANWRCSAASIGSPGVGDSLPLVGDALTYFFGTMEPRLVTTSGGLVLEYRAMIAADELMAIPEVSTDLIDWMSIAAPRQPEALYSDGTASYRVALPEGILRQFVRLRLLPR